MVSVSLNLTGKVQPTARVLTAAGGEFISIDLDPAVTLYAPGYGAESIAFVRKLAAALTTAANQMEMSEARAAAHARRVENAEADATIGQAADAMLGRAV